MNIQVTTLACAAALLWTAQAEAQQESQWIVLGSDAAASFTSTLAATDNLTPEDAAGFSVYSTLEGRTVAEINLSLENLLQSVIHDQHHRCGGYTVHPSRGAALAEANNAFYAPAYLARTGLFPGGVTEQTHVTPALNMVDNSKITDTIQWLQDLGTRYYQNSAGQEAATTLKAQWEGYAPGRPDYSVALYPHSWTQSSVIATITGAEQPEEIVVIGGHLDSINTSDPLNAPGADDDASGVAVVSEVLRVILESGFRPKRTLQFMAYAAEEVGLRGSDTIAQSYKDDGKNVIAALQTDMTGYSGSPNDMYFITDYVSLDLTDYLKSLIAEYNGPGPHQITYGETACGYACSDHVSWTATGVPAAFPFEALFADYNPNIHSPTDVLSNSDTTGTKQAKFAKLGVEFMMEVSKASGATPSSGGGKIGFAWANNPTATSYTPSAAYAHNSAGEAVTVSRSGTGAYTVNFAKLGGHGIAGGNVQVTPYGATPNSCKAHSWSSSGSDFRAHVRCFAPNGTAVNDRFTILVTWP